MVASLTRPRVLLTSLLITWLFFGGLSVYIVQVLAEGCTAGRPDHAPQLIIEDPDLVNPTAEHLQEVTERLSSQGSAASAEFEPPQHAQSISTQDTPILLPTDASLGRSRHPCDMPPLWDPVKDVVVPAQVDTSFPTVTVVCPVCNLRQRWLANLYRMFAHQDYRGPINLLVWDGVCSKLPKEGAPSPIMLELAHRDPRITYYYFPENPPPVLGQKRNLMARNATGEIIVNFDVDDYYGPGYVSKMVEVLKSSGANMVKLHAWFSMGEGWLYDPLRRFPVYTYIDMENDPMGWGWTYVYYRNVFEKAQFGTVDASEEADFFNGIRDKGMTIHTFADKWFLGLRIVTRSIVRTTGAGPCNGKPGCTDLFDFMVLKGFGGEAKLKPWLDLWDVQE